MINTLYNIYALLCASYGDSYAVTFALVIGIVITIFITGTLYALYECVKWKIKRCIDR